MKKRILMCAESSHIGSGFGNYTKNILQRLHDTGKYELAELSCYRDESIPKTEPWTVYPAAVKSNHPLYAQYSSNDANQFGQWLFEFVCIDFKPHIVFDIRDFWNFTYQETSCLRSFYHWMIAPTYDSAPQTIETINSFYNADTLCFHTNWAKNNLINSFNYNGKNIGPVVNDALDHDIFKPIEYSKSHHKQKHNINSDTFIIGSVMRNQKRKLIPDLLETFAKIVSLYDNKNILLYLHTSYPDGLAWDIPSLLLEYNIAHRVLLSYICTKCKHFFPNLFAGTKTICPNCRNMSAVISSVRNSIDESQLNKVYNLFDIYVQYAICEGFGIPPIEAASCGVPVITINSEAMAEIGNNIGADLISVKRKFREQETNAIRSYPDNDELLSIIKKYIDMSLSELNKIGKETRRLCVDNYSWDKTAKIFETVFDSIDISLTLPWDSNKRETNPGYHISGSSNHRDNIYEIIDNIINEPFLKNTNFIEELIKSANQGYVQQGQKSYPFSIKNYVKILESYMNNKSSLEKLRTESIDILSSDIKNILKYSKQ